MKYPKITEENFEEMVKKLVYRKRVKCYTSGKDIRYSQAYHLKVPYPKTRRDFFEMTKNMYGVGLGVTTNSGRSYEIDGLERIYSKLPVARLWDKKYSQYDGLRVFLEYVFNSLVCGGVASRHYGQFEPKGHRHKLRLQKFWQSEFVPSEKIAKSS